MIMLSVNSNSKKLGFNIINRRLLNKSIKEEFGLFNI